jgi:hypothetical protein
MGLIERSVFRFVALHTVCGKGRAIPLISIFQFAEHVRSLGISAELLNVNLILEWCSKQLDGVGFISLRDADAVDRHEPRHAAFLAIT